MCASSRIVSVQAVKLLVACVVMVCTSTGRLSSQQHTAANNLFTAAGFVVRYADTPQKLAHLRKLPADKMVVRSRNGKTYYVYADPIICQCAYVGTPEAYRAFQSGVGSAGGTGESRFDAAVGEAQDQDSASVIGDESFNDYVFGGMR